MRVVCTWDPTEAERHTVADLGDAVWLVDGHRPRRGDGLLTFWPKRELAAAGLKWADVADVAWVKVATAGVNHIGWRDVPDVPVMSTPGATASIIAEYNLGAIIAWARGFQAATHAIQTGSFDVGAPTKALSELSVGLVGYGGIGRATAEALRPFGCRLLALTRTGVADGVDAAFTPDRLIEMAESCDVLVVAVPLRRETQGLIDGDVLSALGDKAALLLNVARGLVVDEDALHGWLQADARHHAHLDVWWQYPQSGRPFTKPFHELKNVTMTPHNAPNVTGHRVTMLGRAVADLKTILGGGPLTHVEDPAAYDMAEAGDTR